MNKRMQQQQYSLMELPKQNFLAVSDRSLVSDTARMTKSERLYGLLSTFLLAEEFMHESFIVQCQRQHWPVKNDIESEGMMQQEGALLSNKPPEIF